MIYLKLISERDENLKLLLLNNVAFVRPFFQIFQSIKENEQLQKPLSCPDWIHFMIQECCSYEAKERPPAIALFDFLTCRWAMIY